MSPSAGFHQAELVNRAVCLGNCHRWRRRTPISRRGSLVRRRHDRKKMVGNWNNVSLQLPANKGFRHGLKVVRNGHKKHGNPL